MAGQLKYFLMQDPYGNWYCIPENMKEEFRQLIVSKDVFNLDTWDDMSEYKVELEKLKFENPVIVG